MNAGSSEKDVPVKTIVPKTKWQNSSDDMREDRGKSQKNKELI